MGYKEFCLKIAAMIKKKKDWVFLPVIKLFSYMRLTPSMITFFSLITGLIAAVSLQFSTNFFLFFIFLHYLFDLFDGSLARYQKSQSILGWWEDYLSDRIVAMSVIFSTILILKWNYLTIILFFLYILINIAYILTKKKYQIIYLEIVYYLWIFLNLETANLFFLIVCAINLLILILGIVNNLSKNQ